MPSVFPWADWRSMQERDTATQTRQLLDTFTQEQAAAEREASRVMVEQQRQPAMNGWQPATGAEPAPPQQVPVQAPQPQRDVPSLRGLLSGTGLESWLPSEQPASGQPQAGVPGLGGLLAGTGLESFLNPTPSAAPNQAPSSPSAPGMPQQPSRADQAAAAAGVAGTHQHGGAGREEDPGDLEAWTRQEAIRLGIDPEMAVRVANTEGGFRDPVRQNMQGAPAYGPYQLYIGGPENPGLGDEAIRRGIDPRNPRHARAGVTLALAHARQNGWGAFQGAAANGIGQWDGIGQPGAPPAMPQAAPQAAAQPSPAWQQNGGDQGPLTPDQSALSDPDKWSLCGPVAAVAMARSRGGQWTVEQAKELAAKNGWWNAQRGMGGLETEAQLLREMGYAAKAGPADWQRIAQDVQSGNPVTLSTRWIPEGHYVVLERYDPQTGKYYVGGAGNVLKKTTGRSNWMTAQEIMELGSINGALFFDNPASPQASVANEPVQQPVAQAAPAQQQQPAAPSSLPPTVASRWRSMYGRDPSPEELQELSGFLGGLA